MAEQDQQGTDSEVSYRTIIEEIGSPSPEGSTIHFGDAEQRAYERFQNVMRMIDERLKI